MEIFTASKVRNCLIFVLSCAVIVSALPGQSMGFCAFTESFLRTSGLSRTAFSAIYMTSTMVGCVGVLLGSKLIDRFGIRRSLLVVLPTWALTLFTFGSCSSICVVAQRFLPGKIFYVLFFTACISVIRMLGQNVLPLLGRMQVIRTFTNRQGLAIASCGLFVALTNGIVPSFMKFLSDGRGWEHAFRALSLGGVALAVLSFMLAREDGDVAIPRQRCDRGNNCIRLAFTSRRELLATPVFWCIALALCVNAFIGSGTAIHIVDIFRENGVSETVALRSYVPLCVSTVFAGFAFGRLVDIERIKLSLLLMFLAQFLGLTGLNLAQYRPFVVLYALSIGATWGAYSVLITVSWSKIFGQKHIGEILGVVYFLSTMSGAVSVPLMSIFKQMFGTYFALIHVLQLAILLSAGFCIAKFPSRGQK